MDPFIYQYLIGGIVFAIGLVYGFRQSYFGTEGTGLRNLIVVLAGLFFFASIQGYLQYAPMTEQAPYVVVDENGQAKANDEILATDYPAPRFRETKSDAEILKIQETAEQILHPKKERSKLGTDLDYGIMIGYFVAMILIGMWFGRGQSTTKDFFFGGQRFSWWLIAFSLVATTIGSSSFVKYSKIAYSYGIASSQTYMNDWFWVPLLLFGWLPILYFSKVISIPEYFQRRFGPVARNISTYLLLAYLIGYVGINLFTMGQALNILIGWEIFTSAMLVAAVSTTYVAFGGQTSVIMTDLFQGVMLLITGLLLLLFGIEYLGGFDMFWTSLPRSHRMAFPDFNADASYPAVGIFWQDAMANSAMFYFLNQGMVMRLMAARSVDDSRKAVMTMLLVLMPIAALVVASGGWVGQALTSAGVLPDMEPKEAFFITSSFLSQPGVFGLVMAALTAALMSTVDTLITAISAIVVNDIYRPLKPDASEKSMLKMARISSVFIAVVGVLLVPVFESFGSIYSAHGAFTAAITPPLVITLLLGVFWRRFSNKAAIITMTVGLAIIFWSILQPEIITPFAHGVPMKEAKEGFLAGKDQYKFMRGFFGLTICLGIGLVTGYLFPNKNPEAIKGLVWGTIKDAIRNYKGSDGTEEMSDWMMVEFKIGEEELQGDRPVAYISSTVATNLTAKKGDLLYISDSRAWLGGLRSTHAIIGGINPDLIDDQIQITPTLNSIAGREGQPLRIKRMY
jgi:solute:Na+ symporter, SSS family